MISRSATRNTKGGVPIHIPLLLFCYSLAFLVCIEFVMLFWLQTSLNTAARQIAISAATNTSFPVEDARNRCIAAARATSTVGPGYSNRVRNDYIAGLEGGMKNYSIVPFDEGIDKYLASSGQQISGSPDELLRQRLSDLGARKPQQGFWQGAGSNNQHGGCFALQNPRTKQITYHTVIHSGCTWPIFIKGFFNVTSRMTGDNSKQGFCGWLEGRGSYIAKASGADSLGVNRSLLTSGVRPCVFCTQNNCDYHQQAQQNIITRGIGEDGRIVGQIGVSRPFDSYRKNNPNRLRANSTIIGTGNSVYAIDQWPRSRGGHCERCNEPCKLIRPRDRKGNPNIPSCKGRDIDPAGIRTIVNCGDIDPLIIVGLRYTCQGELYPDGRVIPLEILGRCDHYFRVIPCGYPDESGVSMKYTAGDVTDLDGKGNPVIVRRKTGQCSNTRVYCRTDSVAIKPWVGPFWAVGAKENMDPNELHKLIKDSYNKVDDATYEAKDGTPQGKNPLANPLDQLIPYNQFCDICNPGSPKCGFFGTCKDEEVYWKEARVLLRGQWWTNTSYYELNPMYFELECKYRRDCQSQHCCWSLWNDTNGGGRDKLKKYCAGREIIGPKTHTIRCGKNRKTKWRYIVVPNAEDREHTINNLPRDGGFPMCSTAAIKKYGQKVGECCAVDVELDPFHRKCPGLPPIRKLKPAEPCVKCNPNTQFCRCNKDKKSKDKFCPSPTCFRPGGKCPVPRKPICRYGKCPKPEDDTTTTTTTTTSTSGDSRNKKKRRFPFIPPIIIGSTPGVFCQYGCVSSTTTTTTTTTTSSSSGGEDCKRKCDLYYSPLIVSLDGSDIKPSGKLVEFKLNPKSSDKFNWIAFKKGQGFIAYDFNGNGTIDSGAELFGNFTNNSQYKDGYEALAAFADKDKNKVVSGDELEGLLLWEDLNLDGKSEKGELSKLRDLGILEINVGKDLNEEKVILADGVFASPSDEDGLIVSIDGKKSTGKSWDVWFRNESTDEAKVTINLWTELKDKLVAFFNGGTSPAKESSKKEQVNE
ncbi:MAG: hypothetical protein QNJ31_02540 [Candidatus Caenarcaniphilales bacterium]|nr:hypothetical protein [Candidatus Caenarcaniphilales bacterium]